MLPGVLFCLFTKFLPDLKGITSSDLTHEVTLLDEHYLTSLYIRVTLTTLDGDDNGGENTNITSCISLILGKFHCHPERVNH